MGRGKGVLSFGSLAYPWKMGLIHSCLPFAVLAHEHSTEEN